MPLSENVRLVVLHSGGEGKTRVMAKGLILCHGDEIFAGEAAGFGLPVLKTPCQTIFPSRAFWRRIPPATLEAVYHLNLINTWQVLCLDTPPVFTRLMEKLVDYYMVRPRLQQSGLMIRQFFLRFFLVRSSMKPSRSFGYCRVRYQTDYNLLEVRVNGRYFGPGNELVLLNEVCGKAFSRMKTGREIREGKHFLPWQPCSTETVIENAVLGLGFSLSASEGNGPATLRCAAGREVGRDLNWAGLALTADQPQFTYQVHFHTKFH